MSFQQLTLYSGTTCAPGSATFGLTTSISALTNGLSTCSSVVGSGVNCKAFGNFSESLSCSSGYLDLIKLTTGPVLAISVYSDVACGVPIQTVVAALDKCTSVTLPDTTIIGLNAVFTSSSNGTIGTMLFDDSACSVVSKKQFPVSSFTVDQCANQTQPALGQCATIPADCASAMSSTLNRVSVRSLKYEQIVANDKKSGFLRMGLSLVSCLTALLLI
ncbi:hypothetical protein HDU79_011367 [Rhizoclosmatium sp. JEL0117]|nr:hypothetical protein HDU79_011367 [Rhizoclosmatium sp. JEL0117]